MIQEPRYKHYTRGGQISFHNLRMWDQITKMLVYCCLGIWVILSAGITWFEAGADRLSQTVIYYYASFLNAIGTQHTFLVPHKGQILQRSVSDVVHNPYYERIANDCFERLINATLMGGCAALVLAGFLAVYFIKKGRSQTENQFIRGSVLKSPEQVKKQIIKNKAASNIKIDGFPLIKNSEVQHVLVHGTVGSGKSQLIMKIMDCIKARGDRVIVYDKGCSLTPLYYREAEDVILNPFDARCAHWDMWREAPRDSDFENMAESLIPMHGESDPFWVNAARTVFASTAIKMRGDTERSIEKLLQLLVTGEFENLEAYLSGTPAATLVSGKIEKTAISIRSVMTTYLKSLQTLSGLGRDAEPSFCIRDTLLDERHTGWLFISSNGEQHKALKPLMSMWLAMASLTLLSLPENRERRIWFICDELPSLHKLPLLGETIAEVRKFGGCFLLGMQSFSQLTKVYGRSGAQELFDLMNTRFFFRSPSAEMARLVSSELGEEDIEESRENYSYGANSVRDGISLSNQRVSRPLVTYPQILELDDLKCFVRLPGHYPICPLTLKIEERSVLNAGFVERDLSKALMETLPLFPEVAAENRTSREPVKAFGRQEKEDSLMDYID